MPRHDPTLLRELRPYVRLHQSPTGLVWIEDGTAGIAVTVHPSIDATGSVRGMKARGYWGRKDRTLRVRGFIYNIDSLAYDRASADDELVRSLCACGGIHGRDDDPPRRDLDGRLIDPAEPRYCPRCGHPLAAIERTIGMHTDCPPCGPDCAWKAGHHLEARA